MAELIEKVARLAGWKRGYLYNTPVFCNSTGDPLVYDDAIESLGLRILLDELLRAGWDLSMDGGRYHVGHNAGMGYEFETGETLEGAIMEAYVTLKEGNNG